MRFEDDIELYPLARNLPYEQMMPPGAYKRKVFQQTSGFAYLLSGTIIKTKAGA
jgi:hypothetical protein